MDILSHTFTGIAVGTVVATISKSSWKRKGLIILIGGLGGALPDLDAISLWSHFDTTIGSFFGLKHAGQEIYFGKFWYSHHAAFHSVLAPILLILFFFLTKGLIKRSFNMPEKKKKFFSINYGIIAFFFGFLFHLFEDMPTPASVWGGVNFFFPSANYVGGFGKIWWWNNYDLFLIIILVIVLNLSINLLPARLYKLKVRTCISVFSIGLVLFLTQIHTRPFDFSYKGHAVDYAKYERVSKNIQREILGDTIYEWMRDIDAQIPWYF